MKFLLVGDIHLADRPPSSCTETYTDDIFDLLYQASEIARREGYSAIILLGDIFHIKMPSRNSHKLLLRMIAWIKQAPCKVIAVAGNHDLSNDRLESLKEGQPLGVLFESGALEFYTGWVPEWPIYVMHWLQDWDAQEDVAEKAVDQALAEWNKVYDGSVPALLVTHAPFYPPGKEPKYENAEVYHPEKFALQMGGHGSVAHGHIHDPHGAYNVGGVRFCNNGALSRGSLTESHLTRQVGVTVWDSSDGSFEFVPLDAKPADQVFRLQEIGEVKSAQAELDKFLASIGETTVEITSIEAVMSHISSLKLDRAVLDVIHDLLTEANSATI